MSVAFDPQVAEVLSAIAENEKRSLSNLIEVLVTEALETRGVIERPEVPKIKLERQQTEGE